MIKQPLLSEQPKIRRGAVRGLDHGGDILEIAAIVNRVCEAKDRLRFGMARNLKLMLK